MKYEGPNSYQPTDMANIKVFTDKQKDKRTNRQKDRQTGKQKGQKLLCPQSIDAGA